MEADSLDRAWDPAAPGAGALRATAIAQLYFRITSHHPLTILIVDAMTLAFGADGVTVQELVDYLGITEDRIRFGLDGIPAEMRSTAQQLEAEGSAASLAGPSAASDAKRDGDNGRQGERSEVRYYLNYKRLLPIVYAHLTRLLLSTCETDVPSCKYVEAIKEAQLAPYSRTGTSTAHAFFSNTPQLSQSTTQASTTASASTSSVQASQVSAQRASPTPQTLQSATSTLDSAGEHIDISDAMKRKSAIRGVYCLGCSCFFLVEEFYETLSKCPRCGKDVLRLCIQAIQRQLQTRLAEQHTLVKLLPAVGQVWKRRMVALAQTQETGRSASAAEDGHADELSSRRDTTNTSKTATAATQQLNCTLANDPFLFQQAVAFLFLYAARFASVNDAASVVDAQEILTEPEYRDRLRGKASLADQFRSRHRHAASIHVRLVSQKEVDAARQQESHRKMLKRAMLPPWLRHTSSLDALGGLHVYSGRGSAGLDNVQKTSADAAEEPWEAQTAKASDSSRGHVDSGGAVWTSASTSTATAAASSSSQKRQRGGDTPANAQAELTRAATFIAEHFYQDEYDEVALPLCRKRQR